MSNEEINVKTGEKIYKTVLPNGLKVFICPKPGYTKKIGMFGTIYGSIDNEFIENPTGKRIKVEDGIAHFLEHKLFEQEGDNALDVFAKMGVSSNAYTSFDHTVYFFETSSKFEVCMDKLLDFVRTPYFTDKNVEKEKGIIAQELRMYDDEPNAVVYYNTLKAMYNKFPLNIDIGGTVESVYRIDKEALYSCYNTFYNPTNMFVIVIGDVDVKFTLEEINKSVNKRDIAGCEVKRFSVSEPKEVAQKEIEKKLDVYMPYLSIGFKHGKKTGKENIKNTLIVELLNDICFSTLSDFYEKMHDEQVIKEPVEIMYECGENFAHTVIMGTSKQNEKLESEIKAYIKSLKKNGIDKEMFELIKKKKQGEYIYETEDMMAIHRMVIDSIIQKTDVFEAYKVLDKISLEDVNNFINNYFTEETMVTSRVLSK